MKLKSISWLVAGLLTSLVSVNTWAAGGSVVCTPGNFSYSTGYSPTAAVDTVTALSFDVSCVRNTTGTDGTVTYAVAFNNGTQPVVTQNQAKNGVNPLNYEFYKDAGCTIKLEGSTTISATTGVVPSGTTTVTPNAFYACIPKLQTATAPSVSYTDTVTLSITGSSSSPSVSYSNGANGTGSVNIIAPVTCTISTAPGTVAFGTYTSLGAAAVGSTSFAANCSNTLPYTMSLDNAFGVVAGLNYSVGLTANSGATTGTTTLASTGTGVAQTFYIKGNMASGQAGSCTGGCDALKTDTRTLTITY